MKEIVVATLLAVGIAASLSGAAGILRMPDVYLRIQAAAKTVTMGALPVLVAIVVAKGPITNYGGRALLVAVLLVITSPLASHALARAAYRSGIPMWRGAVLDQVAQRQRAAVDAGATGSGAAPGGGTPGGAAPGDGTPGGGTPGDGTPGDGTPGDGDGTKDREG